MTKLTANDVATVPPTDKNGEMAVAGALLKRFRKALTEGELHDVEWQRWVARSLLEGLPASEDV